MQLMFPVQTEARHRLTVISPKHLLNPDILHRLPDTYRSIPSAVLSYIPEAPLYKDLTHL